MSAADTPIVLSAQGLVKRFGGITATGNVTLDLRQGARHALIGPNGAGKTTLIHQLSGALAPDSGRIAFDGQDITRLPVHARVRLGLARSFQITSVFRSLSVLDNLALAVQARQGSSLRLWGRASAERARYEEAAQVAARVGLAGLLDRVAGALSHGEQRQLEVGLALATRPRLLLLDEPAAGLSMTELDGLRQLILAISAIGTTVVIVEHHLDLVAALASTVTVLDQGEVLAAGAPDAVFKDDRVLAAYMGRRALKSSEATDA